MTRNFPTSAIYLVNSGKLNRATYPPLVDAPNKEQVVKNGLGGWEALWQESSYAH